MSGESKFVGWEPVCHVRASLSGESQFAQSSAFRLDIEHSRYSNGWR